MRNTIWNKLKTKNKVTSYDISKDTNIPEEKVKEILTGDRNVPTERVDDITKAIQNNSNKLAKDIRYNNAIKFFEENDFKELTKKFNFKSQKELSQAVHVSTYIISMASTHRIKELSKTSVIKLYDFFSDELNIKSPRKKKVKSNTNRTRTIYKIIKKEDLREEVLKWYDETDLKSLRLADNLKIKDLVEKLGFNRSYDSVYCDLERGSQIKNYLILDRLYKYYNETLDDISNYICGNSHNASSNISHVHSEECSDNYNINYNQDENINENNTGMQAKFNGLINTIDVEKVKENIDVMKEEQDFKYSELEYKHICSYLKQDKDIDIIVINKLEELERYKKLIDLLPKTKD